MSLAIDRDVARFKQKLESYTRDAVRKYFQDDSLGVVGKNGRILKVPVPRLRIPQFRFRERDSAGVGMGEGEEGDSVPSPFNTQGDDREEGDLEDLLNPRPFRAGEAYNPQDHEYMDVPQEMVAEVLGEQLELPNLRETFRSSADAAERPCYTSIKPIGPRSLISFRRTFKMALKRAIASGEYDPTKPVIVPRREDERFRAPKVTHDATYAVIIYLLDCSGSMYKTLDFLQEVAWLAESWIQRHYPRTERRYIHYDHLARESTRENFYSISAGGENNMGIAYLRVHQILQEYPREQYNRFVIHLTDGDWFGLDVTEDAMLRYRLSMREHPPEFPPLELSAGNPLTEKIFPQVDGLFVCEAGAYYGPAGFRGYGLSESNFSVLLSGLIRRDPALGQKVRGVSYNDYTIAAERGRCRSDTIRRWFSA